MEERDETVRERDAAAIRLKADIALQIATARGDVGAVEKYQELTPAIFWSYIARTRPVLTYEACVEYVERAAEANRPIEMPAGAGRLRMYDMRR